MGRKLYTLILLIAILAGTFLPTGTGHAAPPPPYAVVQVPRLNVRAAPSTHAPVVGQVVANERVTVLGRNGEGTWLRVESAGGLSGWVYTEMTQLSVPVTAIDVYTPNSNASVGQPEPAAASEATSTQDQTVKDGGNQFVANRQDAPQAAAPAPVASNSTAPAPNPDPRPIGPGSPIPNGNSTAQQDDTMIVGKPLQPLCQPNQLRTVNLGGQPQMITALDDRLYVALANIGSLLVVDAGMDMMLGTSRTSASRIASVTAGDDSLFVVDEEKERLIITSRYGASRGTIELPARPGPVAVTEGRAFVLHPQMGAVSIVDLNSKTTIATLSIGADPRQIVVIAGRAFIGHAAGFLSVVDGLGRRQEQLRLPVNDVVGMTANPRTGMIYIASGLDRRVVAVDTDTWTLANAWDLEIMPSSLAYNDITDHLFVLDSTSQFLTVLSGSNPDRISTIRVSQQPGRDAGHGLVLLQSKLYVMHPGTDYLSVWLDRTCAGELVANTASPTKLTRTDLAPRQVEARIGVVWPHGGLPPAQASYANVTATLLREDGASPSCAWEPEVSLWAAIGSEPARFIEKGVRRMVTENGVTFPVYDFNDVDVRITRDQKLPIHFMVRVVGVETAQNVWTHSATGQYLPTVRPELDGLVKRYTDALDARLWVEDTASGPQIYAMLLQAGTMLGVSQSAVPAPPKLRWALDNGVTEPELVVGQAETRQDNGMIYTVWRFPGLNPDDLLRRAAQARFWVEIPDTEVNSAVLAWGQDIRTLGARLPVPIVGCSQAVASRE